MTAILPGVRSKFFKKTWLVRDRLHSKSGRTGRLPKNSGSMLHPFSVRSYDPRNVWFTIFGYVTATLATFFVGRDAENTEAELAGAKKVALPPRDSGPPSRSREPACWW